MKWVQTFIQILHRFLVEFALCFFLDIFLEKEYYKSIKKELEKGDFL